ncbi:dsDNA break-binding protein [Mycobacterium phage Nebkiss]|nr:dsDNA break-binding protein [Mycobacterium phage Nebkiss]
MRSIFNGVVSFALLNVPVKLYSATEDHDLAMHQAHAADHGRIRYKKVCEVCDETVTDIVKIYEAWPAPATCSNRTGESDE